MPYGLENRDGKRIGDLKAWGELAKPASTTHWKEGRSAMELARAWTTGSGAIDLSALLERARATSGFLPERAIAEAQTAFDSFRGGRRNHDLLVIGRATAGYYGHTLRKSLAIGYVKPAFAKVGTALQIEILGERKRATVLVDSPYDPENNDLRA